MKTETMTPEQLAEQWLLSRTGGNWIDHPKTAPDSFENPDEAVYQFGRESAAYLAGYTADRWIPVSPETMPEEGQYVFVYGTGGRYLSALYRQSTFWAYYPLTEGLEECEEITHWQPLPSPPTK